MLNESLEHQQGQPSIDVLDPAYALFRDQTRFWVQRVAVPLIMVIGLFGNLVTVIIMTRRRMRSTTNMYLAALAFVDMVYLVLTFILGLSHYPNMAERRYYLYWKLRPFLMMFTDACSNTSVWLTVTFTIERFIAVKYPMKGKVWCTEARAKKLIICVFMFGLLFATPVPFEWKVIEKKVEPSTPMPVTISTTKEALDHNYDNNNNNNTNNARPNSDNNNLTDPKLHETKPLDATSSTKSTTVNINLMVEPDQLSNNNDGDVDPSSGVVNRHRQDDEGPNESDDSFILALDYSQFGRNETYKTIYYWSTAVIFYFIPLMSLTLFNGFLIKSVRHSQRERNKMTSRQSFATQTIRSNEKIITTTTGSTACLQELQFQLNKDSKSSRCSNGQPFNANVANGQAECRPTRFGGLKLILLPSFASFKTNNRKQVTFNRAPGVCNSSILSNSNSDNKCLFSNNNDHDELLLTGTSVNNDKVIWNENQTNGKQTKGETCQDYTEVIEFNVQVSGQSSRQETPKTDLSSSKLNVNDCRHVQTNCDLNKNSTERLNLNRDIVGRQSDTILMAAGREPKIASRDSLEPLPSKNFDSISRDSSIMGKVSNEGFPIEMPASSRNINKSNSSQEVVKGILNNPTINTSPSASTNNVTPSNTHTGPPASNQERRITIMLIAVVILFLICQIPSAAMLLYTSVHETIPNTNEHALLLAFGNIFNFLMAINAAGNFILYSFLSKKYRRTFVIIFCGCLGASKMAPRQLDSQRTKQYATKHHNHQSFHASSSSLSPAQITGASHSNCSQASRMAGVRFGNIDHRVGHNNECLLTIDEKRQRPDTLV